MFRVEINSLAYSFLDDAIEKMLKKKISLLEKHEHDIEPYEEEHRFTDNKNTIAIGYDITEAYIDFETTNWIGDREEFKEFLVKFLKENPHYVSVLKEVYELF